jgi:hypothetical protein
LQVELLVLNMIVFSALALGLAVRMRRKSRGPEEVGAIYRRLGFTLTKKFPDLPPGFTWREGLERARPTSPGIDWALLENELGSYEAFRYGGGSEPTVLKGETLKLLRVLGDG